MAILPLGTANNIAHALGMSRDVEALVASWSTARLRPFDVGLVHGGGDAHRFLESVGVGLFPDTMAEKKRQRHADVGEEQLGRDIAGMLETIAVERPTRWRVELDGCDLSGEHLAIEAMNVGTLGPLVPLAPQADPGDGLLDVVTVPVNARRALTEHLERRLHHEHHTLDLPVARGRQLVFYGGISNVHVDGRLVRAKALGSRMLTIHVGIWSHALDILV